MTQTHFVRETGYAGVRCEGIFEFAHGGEIRMERLLVKSTNEEEIRFSWWKDGKFITRPMHATEEQLLALFKDGIEKDVLTLNFRQRLKRLL